MTDYKDIAQQVSTKIIQIFYDACISGNQTVMRLFLDCGFDPTKKYIGGRSAIEVSIANNSLPAIIKIQKWIRTRNSGVTLDQFLLACKNGQYQIVDNLLQLGISPTQRNKDGLNAIAVARLNNKHDILAILENNILYENAISGGDPNAVDSRGTSVLVYLVGSGEYEAVKYLLEKGADPKLKNIDGIDAIKFAEITKNWEIHRLLTRYS